jgi:hypothetical protein
MSLLSLKKSFSYIYVRFCVVFWISYWIFLSTHGGQLWEYILWDWTNLAVIWFLLSLNIRLDGIPYGKILLRETWIIERATEWANLHTNGGVVGPYTTSPTSCVFWEFGSFPLKIPKFWRQVGLLYTNPVGWKKFDVIVENGKLWRGGRSFYESKIVRWFYALTPNRHTWFPTNDVNFDITHSELDKDGMTSTFWRDINPFRKERHLILNHPQLSYIQIPFHRYSHHFFLSLHLHCTHTLYTLHIPWIVFLSFILSRQGRLHTNGGSGHVYAVRFFIIFCYFLPQLIFHTTSQA